MASAADRDLSSGSDREPSLGEKLRTVLISGAAITIPLLVTIIVLTIVINFVLQTISPLVIVVERTLGVGRNLSDLALEAIAILTLLALVFVVGLVAETTSGSGIERAFDTAMARIPGVGSVYTSFNEMSELLLSNDTQSFREVKLVEFPSAGMYTVAFVTAETPDVFRDGTGHEEMTTLFMPLAPNPVMGGFVLHVAEERVHDVDLSVEEGVRSIVTSGVATGDADSIPADGELIDLGAIRKQAVDGMEDIGDWGARTADDITDFATTVEDIETLKEQTRQEFISVREDTTDENDGDDAARHYMLDRSGETEEAADAVDESPDGWDADGDGDGEGGDSTTAPERERDEGGSGP